MQEYWSGLPCPPLGGLSNPGIEPRSPTLQVDSLPSEPPGKPKMKLQRGVEVWILQVMVECFDFPVRDNLWCDVLYNLIYIARKLFQLLFGKRIAEDRNGSEGQDLIL